jgi:hypothetical protein
MTLLPADAPSRYTQLEVETAMDKLLGRFGLRNSSLAGNAVKVLV